MVARERSRAEACLYDNMVIMARRLSVGDLKVTEAVAFSNRGKHSSYTSGKTFSLRQPADRPPAWPGWCLINHVECMYPLKCC